MTGTLPAPRVIGPSDVRPLRWGIVGTGWIATRFARALHTHTTQRIVAVAARSTERTIAFAAEHGIEKASPTPEALVSDSSVDVVYIATPTAHTASSPCSRSLRASTYSSRSRLRRRLRRLARSWPPRVLHASS